MPITNDECNSIIEKISPIFDQVVGEYDLRKYPAANYESFKNTFSSLADRNHEIEDAMKWKWGHWGKPNFPQKHKDLIAEIEGHWPNFAVSDNSQNPELTFQWWKQRLNRPTTYITVAYITHLVHHTMPLPIIDQHNFRAMNSLIGCQRPERKAKKKPSNYQDIITLRSFMTLLKNGMPNRSFSEIDRFLMMYGRNYCAR